MMALTFSKATTVNLTFYRQSEHGASHPLDVRALIAWLTMEQPHICLLEAER